MNTQQRLFSILQKTGPHTIWQLSKELGITKAAVRYQICELLDQGLIVKCPPGLITSAGRPATRYQVNPLPNTKLSILLIKELSNEIRHGGKIIDLNEFADRLSTAMLESGEEKGETKAARINLRLLALTELGFDLIWEASPNGPVITVRYEPLSSVIPDPVLVDKILKALLIKIKK